VCGRFTLSASPEAVASAFSLEETPQLRPRFNVAPGQQVATVEVAPEGGRRLVPRRWGLVPRWARDARIGSRLINARCETVAEKPAYRDAFRKRRCLVPADGFYEWASAGSGPRQPYWIARPDRGCIGIAGLYERWRGPDDVCLDSCTLLTTEASGSLRAIHGRMPVILPPEAFGAWLDPEAQAPEALLSLLHATPSTPLEAIAVSRRVNRPEHDDPDCIAPLPATGAVS
jgi:putative SOS response-associated peptidase YedK